MKKRPMQERIDQRGFSLVELMVAMVVLAIGIMATMAMQYTALAGYTSAREMTGATEVARVVEQRLRTESLQWQAGQNVGATTAVYTDGGTLLASLTADTWTNAFDNGENPVTLRIDDQGPRRFCAWVQGARRQDAQNVPQDYMWAIIAVVYRAPGSGTPIGDGDCDSDISDLLDTGNREPLELEGYRATFVSTSIQPRQP